jgi:formylglycine-generating enzyme required for sulfatase activity
MIDIELVEISEGTFLMGSPAGAGAYDNEHPQHVVTVPSFLMGKFPITQAQYKAVMGNNPSCFDGEDQPVERVSWNQAVEFCQKLSEQSGKVYRLPSEAEWEYACRAGTTTTYSFGDLSTKTAANYDSKSTTKVGSFPANDFELSDMHGNVWEWCLDHYHENYKGAPTNGSAWTAGGNSDGRVVRGGSWFNSPWYCRSGHRGWYEPGNNLNIIGFRVVCEMPEKE